MQPHRPHEKGTDGDFGVRPDEAARRARDKGSDRAGRPAGDHMVGSGGSVREHGVGAHAGGRGKGSGGDVDEELLGYEAIPGRIEDAARNPDGTPNIGGGIEVEGSIQPSGPAAAERGDHDDSQSGGGVANNRGATENDAFVSEITRDEADGRDERGG